MMASMAQAYSPHPAGLQHPGVGPGHPMGPGHPQQGGGQPGPGGIPQQIHMSVSGPGGPQAAQAGAMLGVMPPGVSGTVGPNAHALQHLNPNQAQMYNQQQAQIYGNPQMHMTQHILQQQHQARQQQARQAMIVQQFGGNMPMNMSNGMNPQMNAAQFQGMRGNPNMRPVSLPSHLQQQQAQAQAQAQAQLGIEQAQQQQHQHQQHQHLVAQQMAMQQANANSAGQAANTPGQANQLGPQQIQNLQNAQMAAAAAAQHQQHQHQQQQQQQGGIAQPPQVAGQAQPQISQTQQPQPQTAPQQPNPQQQQQIAAAAASIMQGRPRDQIKGHCILKLVQFGDHLSDFVGSKQRDDINYWSDFVETFFSPQGVLRHSLWMMDEGLSKQYEITFPALARYFYTHFESGISNIQLITEKAKEKELPNNCHYIESQKSSFIYWFENGSQLVASGTLRAQFDANQKIELLEFVTSHHEEYIPRAKVIDAARPLHDWTKEWHAANKPPDGKQSPETSKKKSRPMKSPQTAPPDINIPDSKVKANMGITSNIFQFLEFAEVLGQMNPLFNYSHQKSNLAPYSALDQYVANITLSAAQNSQGLMQPGQRTPSMSQFNLGQSPSAAHLALPDNANNGSPALGHMQAPGMALQQSQQGTSSSGPSANTSPNVSNKRRRPSVKTEGDEAIQANGVQPKVKPSPTMNPKRRKGPAA